MPNKKDLEDLVDFYNKKYCKHTKNELVVHRAYGGYCVELTGKRNKRTGRPLKGSIGTGCADVGNPYHDSASKTIEGLYKADSRGWLKSTIRQHENKARKSLYGN